MAACEIALGVAPMATSLAAVCFAQVVSRLFSGRRLTSGMARGAAGLGPDTRHA
jgi:hypothetical protein